MAEQASDSMRTRPFPFPLPHGFFRDDNPPPADPPSGDPPTGDPPAGDPPADRTFTQADVDRIVQDRVARVKNQPPADYEDLKAAAARLAEIEAANKTELEKANERATKAEESAQRALEAANQRLIEAAVLAEATAQKAIKPEHLHRLIDTESVTVGDDGQVTGAKDAVEAFLKANPEYVGSGGPGGSADQGARKNGKQQLSREQLQGMTPAEIVKAQEDGRLDSLLGVS